MPSPHFTALLSLTPPLPDLGLGYRRLVTHLELLDRFVVADPANPPPTLRPQVGVSGDTSGGVSVGSNTPGSSEVGKDDSKKAGGAVCAAVIALIILFVILLVVTLIKCIIEWADGKKCNYFEELGDTIKDLFEEDPPHPSDPPTTQDPQMTGQRADGVCRDRAGRAARRPPVGSSAADVGGARPAYGFLAKAGLIYPDALVVLPGYKQFTSTPGVASNKWPHRPEADPEATYHLYPNTPLEEPVEAPSPFSFGAWPNAFAMETHVAHSPAAHFALPLWRQMAQGDQDSTNYDLDADRGNNHPCWATGGSIDDNPVDVIVLGYEEQ